MKQPKRIACYSIILLATHSQILNAADISTINITGNVIASPCVVDNSSSIISVDLGKIQATTLSTAGKFSEWKPFDIVLTNCPASTSQVNVAFSGTQDSTDSTRYKNLGTATNLTIELVGAVSGINLGDGQTTYTMVSNTSMGAKFSLKTRAYSKGDVMPGSINATVVASFTYK